MAREVASVVAGAWGRGARAASANSAAEGAETAAKSRVDWERLWLATQRTEWRSLALVPVGEGISTAPIASELAEIGRTHLGGTVIAHDATKVSISSLRGELAMLSERAGCSHRALVALPPVLGSPAGLALAQAADGVILCVALGRSSIAEAQKIVAEVGRERVLGSVIVHERKGKP
jgi:hypothetical protein